MVTFAPRPTRLAQRLRRDATDAERHLWRHLNRRQLGGFKFNRQMPVGRFVCDFMCREAGLIVEVDGGQHDEDAAQDAYRTEYIEGEGYKVLRFWNVELLENIDGVLSASLESLESAHRQPLPQAGGGSE